MANFTEDDLLSFAEWMKNSTTEWRRFGSIFDLHYHLTPEEQYIVFRTAARLANFGMTEEERALTTTESRRENIA